MTHTVVIVGAGMAGIPLTGYFLRNTAPKVKGGLKVILISPNDHFFWNLGVMRGILPDDGFPDEKLFYPIAPAFAAFGPDRFEFVLASATSLDTASNAVVVSTSRQIRYDTLIIATGSHARDGAPFKGLGSTDDTKAGMHEYQRRIAAASSIVVGGAGPTGVEVAGELGYEYARTGRKSVTLLAYGDLPLYDEVRRDIRELAKRQLEDLGVKVITNAKVAATHQDDGASKTTTTLDIVDPATGKKKDPLTTDFFVPTFGVAPNTSWLPPHLLDGDKRVKQTRSLRVQGLDNVFVAGDAGNLAPPSALHMDAQVQWLAKALHAQLTGAAKVGDDFEPPQGVIFGVTIGRSTGTGQYNSWKLPALLIWFSKSRFMGTDYAPVYAKGLRTIRQQKW